MYRFGLDDADMAYIRSALLAVPREKVRVILAIVKNLAFVKNLAINLLREVSGTNYDGVLKLATKHLILTGIRPGRDFLRLSLTYNGQLSRFE